MIGEARAQYLAWRGAAFAIPAVPSPIDPFIARALGGLAYAGAARARAAVRDNLTVIAPRLSRGEREALVRRTFTNQARNYLATLRLPHLDLARAVTTIPVRGWENVDAALASGRGVILGSAHFGQVSAVGPVVLALHRVPVSIVVEPIAPRLFDLINRTLRGSLGPSFVSSSEILRLARMLTRGGTIGVLGDRPVMGARLRIPFFGREAYLPTGHVVLAALTGAALIPAFAVPGPAAEMHPPLALIEGRGEDVLHANLLRWAAVLERLLAVAPDEWHVFERFWSA